MNECILPSDDISVFDLGRVLMSQMCGELAEGTLPNVAGLGRELPLLSPSLKDRGDGDSPPRLLLLRVLPFREGLKERVGAVVAFGTPDQPIGQRQGVIKDRLVQRLAAGLVYAQPFGREQLIDLSLDSCGDAILVVGIPQPIRPDLPTEGVTRICVIFVELLDVPTARQGDDLLMRQRRRIAASLREDSLNLGGLLGVAALGFAEVFRSEADPELSAS